MTVWIPDHNCLGKVVTQVGTQSYQAKTSYGLLRCNCRHLIASLNEHFEDEINANLKSLPDLLNNNSSLAWPDPLPRRGSISTHAPEGLELFIVLRRFLHFEGDDFCGTSSAFVRIGTVPGY